jgi:O-succinylbenzoate synthase
MANEPGRVESVTAALVVLPLRFAFTSAATKLVRREVVLVSVRSGDHVGWGEAAPVPGHTIESVDDIWGRIGLLASAVSQPTFPPPPGLLGAAFDQAHADLVARQRGMPLWRVYGGGNPVAAGAAIPVNHNGDPDRHLLESAAAAGYRFAKLKVTGNTIPDHVAAAVAAYPQIRFGIDANGTLGPADMDLLHRLDELGFDYIEQPGAPSDLHWHRVLRDRLATPVSLDEAAGSPDAVARIVANGAADIVNLKAGRFGPATTLELAALVTTAGLECRLGGLIETGVGRAHSVALAAHDHFSVVGDVAGSDRYFDDDLVRPQWRLHDGILSLPEAPGIGVEVDADAVAAHTVATTTFS